jgi:hypothetical protein
MIKEAGLFSPRTHQCWHSRQAINASKPTRGQRTQNAHPHHPNSKVNAPRQHIEGRRLRPRWSSFPNIIKAAYHVIERGGRAIKVVLARFDKVVLAHLASHSMSRQLDEVRALQPTVEALVVDRNASLPR